MRKRRKCSEPEGHWHSLVTSDYDEHLTKACRDREKAAGRPLTPVERFWLAHEYADKAEAAARVAQGEPLQKSRPVKGNIHTDPRSGKAVVVPAHTDRRAPRKAKPAAKRRVVAIDNRKPLPSQWDGQGERVGPTEAQLGWAKEKHGIRIPPGKPTEDGGHTVHHVRTYDPPLRGRVVAQWFDAKGKRVDAYTQEHVAEAADKKWDSMFAFEKALPRVRKAVAAGLAEPTLTKNRVTAAVVAIVDQTAMRIGSAQFAEREENPTFGASSLLKKHAEVRGDSVVFSFPGKHNVPQERRVTGKALVATIRALLKQPGDRLFAYPDANGEPQSVKETTVGAWLDGFGVHPKQWRTYHACKLFLRYTAEMAEAETEAQRKKNVTAAVKLVSEFLGNTPAVCRKDYINPALIERYMTDGTTL